MRQLCVAIALASAVIPIAGAAADASICPAGLEMVALVDGPAQCAHPDAPPASSARSPKAFSAGAEARRLECFGDGEDGRRLQALYVTDRPGSLGRIEATAIANGMINTQVIYEDSALSVSDDRLVPRWAHTPDCQPSIVVVTVASAALEDFGSTIRAVSRMGFDRPDRKYIMWADSDRLCGIAGVSLDERKRNNANDGARPGYARVDRPCWGYEGSVVAHEVTHTLGAVLPTAPNATPSGHCTDEYDLMCYPDAPGVVMETVCIDRGRDLLLDCNNDDYFHPNPPPGSWLSTHWNVADSSFLQRITPELTGGERFTDVGADLSMRDSIEWLADRGITRGCEAGRFCPDDPVTRGQMAAFLHRFAGGDGTWAPPFEDVAAADSFAGDIGWLAGSGITHGCENGRFCPGRVVTRGQMAAFLYRMAGDRDGSGAGAGGSVVFADVPPGAPFSTEIGWLAGLGVSRGCGGSDFCPDAPVTRAQMAAFLHRLSVVLEYAPGG